MSSHSSELRQQQKSVAEQANSQENAHEILLSRLSCTKIFSQVVDMNYESEMEFYRFIKNSTWKPTGGTMTNDVMLVNEEGKFCLQSNLSLPKPERVLEEARAMMDLRLEKTGVVVDVGGKGEPNSQRMTTHYIMPGKTEKFTMHQMGITMAHEAGHRIRRYRYLQTIFSPAFDFSKCTYDKEFMIHFMGHDDFENPQKRIEHTQKRNEYLSNPVELAERMGQLKNYFGFKGAEVFTKEHLDYAREHYVADTGMDNLMTQFFEAITPETEEAFLEIINSAGI